MGKRTAMMITVSSTLKAERVSLSGLTRHGIHAVDIIRSLVDYVKFSTLRKFSRVVHPRIPTTLLRP